ncbi:LysE family translocator [Ideonella livida]|uniref:LysE family translocator n=1 Tax=Ideonella livida TaxID=2707176 RepID=A0A7C9TJM8_9BURK|nr:LysE family translocator [Ideonella livida]NDY90347.1 LysE family translocator [Ideonella livida]
MDTAVSAHALLLFALTVLPLVCTPGPDILLIVSQALTAGWRGALRANVGILLGYTAHALLTAAGVAALLATSPRAFEVLRWVAIAYLGWLALQMFRAALRPATGPGQTPRPATAPVSLLKGFMTSLLNPKGMLVYFAILPPFMQPAQPVLPQALALSAVFIALCGGVYAVVGAAVAWLGRRGRGNQRLRRLGEGAAGGLLMLAALRLVGRSA